MVASPSFDDYVAARWRHLVRCVILLGADRHAAEDVVQSALARCYFKWNKVVDKGDPDAYVYRAVVNEFTSSRRRLWRREVPTDASSAALPEIVDSDEIERLDAQTLVRDALRALPRAQQQVIALRFFADLTERQVSQILGIPVGTVKSRTARGLATLSNDSNLTALLEGRTP